MFDDGLVDGRILAQVWGGIQQTDIYCLNNSPTIYVTPFG
jgi:hypothetical protein